MEKIQSVMGVEQIEVLDTRPGGFISLSKSYQTEKGKFFIKFNEKPQTRRMFDGEWEGLKAISALGYIRCPQPYEILDLPDGPGAIFVLEHFEGLQDLDHCAAQLGEQVASMHLHNIGLKEQEERDGNRVGFFNDTDDEGTTRQRYIDRFGFHATTCCGFIPNENNWTEDWVTFYTRHRLQPRVAMIEEEYGDRDLLELWPRLVREIPRLFRGLDRITPSLLHGDLHGCNVGEMETGPVVCDPACVYGHHEFELATTTQFTDFPRAFFSKYHQLIPKAPGFDDRKKLYELYYFINNWNHFGPQYKNKIISIIRELIASS